MKFTVTKQITEEVEVNFTSTQYRKVNDYEYHMYEFDPLIVTSIYISRDGTFSNFSVSGGNIAVGNLENINPDSESKIITAEEWNKATQ